jgi:hypothetical protein
MMFDFTYSHTHTHTAEEFLKVSGVLAVVVFGLYLNVWGRTSISHEVEHFLHRFYEMMGYLANTLIFTLSGLIAATRSSFGIVDLGVLMMLYVMLHVIRGLVVFAFRPALQKTGYGLTRHDAMIVTYGGLRGVVGLALALVVVESDSQRRELWEVQGLDDKLEGPSYGGQVLFLCTGIVVLTLVVNGSTVRFLLKALGMTQINDAERQQHLQAQKNVNHATTRKQNALKMDTFLSDANWEHVKSWVHTFEAPETERHKLRELRREPTTGGRKLKTQKELNEHMTENRIRFLKAQKQSYWVQFAEGVIGQQEILALVELTDSALDHKDDGKVDMLMVKSDQIEALMAVPHMLHKLYDLLHNLPCFNRYMRTLVFNRLFFSFRVGVAYIRAQQAVQRLIISELNPHVVGAGHKRLRKQGGARKASARKDSEAQHSQHSPHKSGRISLVSRGSATEFDYQEFTDVHSLEVIREQAIESQKRILKLLFTLREAYPRISSAIKSTMAAQTLLNFQLSVIKGMVHRGALDENFALKMIEDVEETQKRLRVRDPPVEVPKNLDLVGKIPWMQGADIDMKKLIRHTSEQDVAVDHRLFSEGDKCDGIYLIARGVARVTRSGKTLALVGPGQLFGELAVLTKGLRSADVEAETYLVTLRIHGDYLMKLMQENPTLHRQLWHAASGKFAISVLRRLAPFSGWGEETLQNWVHNGSFRECGTQQGKYFEDYLVVVISGSVHLSSESVQERESKEVMSHRMAQAQELLDASGGSDAGGEAQELDAAVIPLLSFQQGQLGDGELTPRGTPRQPARSLLRPTDKEGELLRVNIIGDSDNTDNADDESEEKKNMELVPVQSPQENAASMVPPPIVSARSVAASPIVSARSVAASPIGSARSVAAAFNDQKKPTYSTGFKVVEGSPRGNFTSPQTRPLAGRSKTEPHGLNEQLLRKRMPLPSRADVLNANRAAPKSRNGSAAAVSYSLLRTDKAKRKQESELGDKDTGDKDGKGYRDPFDHPVVYFGPCALDLDSDCKLFVFHDRPMMGAPPENPMAREGRDRAANPIGGKAGQRVKHTRRQMHMKGHGATKAAHGGRHGVKHAPNLHDDDHHINEIVTHDPDYQHFIKRKKRQNSERSERGDSDEDSWDSDDHSHGHHAQRKVRPPHHHLLESKDNRREWNRRVSIQARAMMTGMNGKHNRHESMSGLTSQTDMDSGYEDGRTPRAHSRGFLGDGPAHHEDHSGHSRDMRRLSLLGVEGPRCTTGYADGMEQLGGCELIQMPINMVYNNQGKPDTEKVTMQGMLSPRGSQKNLNTPPMTPMSVQQNPAPGNKHPSFLSLDGQQLSQVSLPVSELYPG